MQNYLIKTYPELEGTHEDYPVRIVTPHRATWKLNQLSKSNPNTFWPTMGLGPLPWGAYSSVWPSSQWRALAWCPVWASPTQPGDGEKYPAPLPAPPMKNSQTPWGHPSVSSSPSCTNPVCLPSFIISHHKYFAGLYFIIMQSLKIIYGFSREAKDFVISKIKQ